MIEKNGHHPDQEIIDAKAALLLRGVIPVVSETLFVSKLGETTDQSRRENLRDGRMFRRRGTIR